MMSGLCALCEILCGLGSALAVVFLIQLLDNPFAPGLGKEVERFR